MSIDSSHSRSGSGSAGCPPTGIAHVYRAALRARTGPSRSAAQQFSTSNEHTYDRCLVELFLYRSIRLNNSRASFEVGESTQSKQGVLISVEAHKITGIEGAPLTWSRSNRFSLGLALCHSRCFASHFLFELLKASKAACTESVKQCSRPESETSKLLAS